MIGRIIFFAIVGLVIIWAAGLFEPQAQMESVFENIPISVTTLAYAGEFGEIRSIAYDFIKLRSEPRTESAKLMASQLDERINGLELVKIYCNEKISSLKLASERDPYYSLQQLCPVLKKISFAKAVQLFDLI
jgi:hypothetical protein